MKKFYKIAGIVAGALLIVGSILFGIGYVNGAERSGKLFGFINYNINDHSSSTDTVCEYTVLDEFSQIDITVNMANVNIVEGDEFAIEFCTSSDRTAYDVTGGILHFAERASNDFVSLDFSWIWPSRSYYVTVYVPEDMEQITINTDLGNVKINNVSSAKIDLQVNSGDVTVTDCTVDELIAVIDMGNIDFDGTVSKLTELELSMGNADIKGYLACDIDITSDMGNVDVTTYYNSDSYRMNSVTSDMGNVDYNYIGGETLNEKYDIKVDNSMGDIVISFLDK